MVKKSNTSREQAIIYLVQHYSIEDQDQLVSLLKDKYQIETNQSIISRDLRRLGIAKHMVHGKFIYQIPLHDPTREILRLAVLAIEHNETMIVVKTVAGLATFVGDYLDTFYADGILATLAGENVVLVVPIQIKKMETIIEIVKRVLYSSSADN